MVAFFFATLLVDYSDQTGTVHRHDLLAAAFDHFQVDELHETVVARFDLRLFGDSRRRAADVERAHGQLCARLADGLRRNEADRFAPFHETPGRQVTAIATAANSASRFTSQHRANFDALDASRLNRVGQFLGDFLVDLDHHVPFVVFDLLE